MAVFNQTDQGIHGRRATRPLIEFQRADHQALLPVAVPKRNEQPDDLSQLLITTQQGVVTGMTKLYTNISNTCLAFTISSFFYGILELSQTQTSFCCPQIHVEASSFTQKVMKGFALLTHTIIQNQEQSFIFGFEIK